MQTTITVKATTRQQGGKSGARRLRAEGKMPAVMYGPGEPSRAISLNAKDVQTILAAPLGRNTVVTLDVDGATTLGMLKGFSYHPLTRELEHADFYTVKLDRKITVPVPLTSTGRAKGVATEGGILRQVFRTLPVFCTPDRIPARIEADVTEIGLGEAVHVRDLKLAEGVSIKLDAGQTVFSVVAPEKEEKAAEAAPGAPGAPAAAAAAAPAKGAAPAKDAKAAAPAKDAKAAAPAKKK